MKRNLKALGLLAFAALAMSAMFAASASAQGKGELTIGETLTPSPKHTASSIHGAQVGTSANNYFETSAGDVLTCENEGVTMTASTETGTEKEITVTPTYKDCFTLKEGAEDRPVTVTMEGCKYVLHQPEALDETDDVWTGKTSLVCPEGKTPKIHIYQFGSPTSHSFKVCEIDITPFGAHGNEEKAKPHYVATVDTDAQVTPGVFRHDITLQATVEGIIVHKSGLCGSAELQSTYANSLTVTAKSGNEHHDIWISTVEE